MKKYFLELFFYKENIEKLKLDLQPNPKAYSSKTVMVEVTAPDWDTAKSKVITKSPSVAYIHIIESVDLSI